MSLTLLVLYKSCRENRTFLQPDTLTEGCFTFRINVCPFSGTCPRAGPGSEFWGHKRSENRRVFPPWGSHMGQISTVVCSPCTECCLLPAGESLGCNYLCTLSLIDGVPDQIRSAPRNPRHAAEGRQYQGTTNPHLYRINAI